MKFVFVIFMVFCATVTAHAQAVAVCNDGSLLQGPLASTCGNAPAIATWQNITVPNFFGLSPNYWLCSQPSPPYGSPVFSASSGFSCNVASFSSSPTIITSDAWDTVSVQHVLAAIGIVLLFAVGFSAGLQT